MSLTNTPTNAPPLFCFDASATFLGHSDLSRSTRYRIILLWPRGYGIAQRSQWRAYIKPPSLFRIVPSLTSYEATTSPSPKIVFHICPTSRYANGHISATGDPIHFMFGSRYRVFGVGGSNGAISGYIKSKMAVGRHLRKFRMAISPQQLIRSTYRARIARSTFAIAQLSCFPKLV